MSTNVVTPYTIVISKGSALLPEMKALLRAYQPGETLTQFRDRVLSQDVLGKVTAQRARDLVQRVFAPRFLANGPERARWLKTLVEGGAPAQLVSDLCFLYSARNDKLLRDVVAKVFWPALERGQIAFGTRDVISFIQAAESEGKLSPPWSEAVRLKVSRGIVRAMADFGLLAELARSRFEMRMFRSHPMTPVYLAYELHFAGHADATLVQHEDWRLFGFRTEDVMHALDQLTAEGWWLVQAAGSVVRMTWNYPSMEEVVRALAR